MISPGNIIEYIDGDNNKKKRNISFVSDLWPLCRFFFVAPENYDKEDKFVRKNWKETTAQEMDQLIGVLSALDDNEFTVEEMKPLVDAWSEATGVKPWNAWRVCLVGMGQGPDMYELAAFLGKQETLKRMENAIAALG